MKKILLLLGIILGLVLSLVGAELIERTSDVEFCSSCHSMQGVSAAWEADIHGGMNKRAIRANCVRCHLPHDNTLNYVVTKAYTGIKDVLGELFWADTFDWKKNLEKREEFTYSSGCETCHDLNVMTYDIPKTYQAHKDYQTGKVKSCVFCHEHVGHKDIKSHL